MLCRLGYGPQIGPHHAGPGGQDSWCVTRRPARLFPLFNEIGIIEQLSRARFEARLPQGVTGPHFSVLNHLMRVADGRTPLELARAFQVPKTTLSHTLGAGETRLDRDAPEPR
jgi:hypothetical protein